MHNNTANAVAASAQNPITPNDCIFMITQHLNENDSAKAYEVIEKYLSKLSQTGTAYSRLRRLIKQKPVRMQYLKELPKEIKNLLQETTPSAENVFLGEPIKIIIEDLITEWKNGDIHKMHNLCVRNKILLHGPTGNGKTTIAKYIAARSGLPFYEASSDLIVSSKLGESGQNIFSLLNTLKFPCILFWDEVDNVGCKRSGDGGGGSAVFENDRMVNSLLVNMEKLHPDVILIGATNRYEILDPAFLRRFDLTHQIENPNLEEKTLFEEQMIRWYNIGDYSFKRPDLEKTVSFSAIKQYYADEARKIVAQKIRDKNEEAIGKNN